MSVVRIRVVAKYIPPPNASRDEKERAFKVLLGNFRTQVNKSGIITQYKERQVFETKTQKRRRKEWKADLLRKRESDKLKTRLREHFG